MNFCLCCNVPLPSTVLSLILMQPFLLSPLVTTLCLHNCPFQYIFLQKSSVDVEAKMSLADRMKILKDKEEQWKNKGKGAANDSIQFTVAGRMAKRGNVLMCVYSADLHKSNTAYCSAADRQSCKVLFCLLSFCLI